jgi:Putative MetA-pathway of phenol degradation
MASHRTTLRFLIVIVFLACVANVAAASSGYRKTLLQWSYGTSFEGGPDVYEPLVTDRPDFTESSVTVGYGVAQLETGYTFTHDSEGDDRVRGHSFPESLLRVGMFADWFELRIDWNYVEERTEIGGVRVTTGGAEDLGLGVKLALTPQESMLPETAIILQMSLPTGASAFTADEVLPGFNYLYGWDINDNWATGGSTAVNRAVDELTGDAYVEFAQAWTVGRSWGERVGSYAEWFVLAPTSADTSRTEHYFNGGFTVLLNNDLQWDIRAGLGLNDAADDFFAGSGLSLRYW